MLRLCLLGVCLLSSACPCLATCSLPVGTTQWIENLKKMQNSPKADFELGAAEVDTPGCLDAAIETFRSLANTDDDQQKQLVTGMLAVANARKLIASGNRPGAIQDLVNIASNYEGYFPAYLRAIRDLTLLLRDHPDAPEWKFLGAQLDKITANDDVDGIVAQSIAEMALHDIRMKRSEEGLSRMEKYLAEDHSVQIRLLSSILYLELLRAADYTSNARVLCQELDSEVGRVELDPSMRVQFLQVCSAVYANSSDPQGQMRYARFSAVLAKAQGELQ